MSNPINDHLELARGRTPIISYVISDSDSEPIKPCRRPRSVLSEGGRAYTSRIKAYKMRNKAPRKKQYHFTGFTRLPGELRTMIYEIALFDGGAERIHSMLPRHARTPFKRYAVLRLASKQLDAEVTNFYYRNVTFHFYLSVWLSYGVRPASAFLATIGPTKIGLMRHVQFFFKQRVWYIAKHSQRLHGLPNIGANFHTDSRLIFDTIGAHGHLCNIGLNIADHQMLDNDGFLKAIMVMKTQRLRVEEEPLTRVSCSGWIEKWEKTRTVLQEAMVRQATM